METLEGRVGAYLAQNHVKKHELANALGMSLVTFNRRVRGESDLTVVEARKLAKAMDMPFDEICNLVP